MLFDIFINDSKILIIDDSKIVQMKIENMLIEQVSNTFDIRFASNAEDGLKSIEESMPDIIILDVEMPGMSGLELCKILKGNPETDLIPIIILTSSDSIENKTLALYNGANEFLSKNQDWVDLKLKVESLLKLKYTISRLERAENVVSVLSKAIGLKDTYTEEHGERVSYYATKIAEKVHLTRYQIQDITIAGFLHDIGKLAIPDNILNKIDKLSDEEFEIIKKHPVSGYELCLPIQNFEKVCNIIRSHHEKLNGTGYPDKLKDKQISIEAKIMAVADIYDALISKRSYREAVSNIDAFKIMDDMVKRNELSAPLVDILKQIVNDEEKNLLS